MSPSQVIVLATPVFLGMIALEFAWGWSRARRGTGRNTYRMADAMTSIGLGMLSQITAVFTRLFRVGIYTAVHSLVALWHNEAFWTAWYGWLLALVFYDFCYYWLHRAGHESAVFWAAHVVHHQSQDYNLSTALRQTSSGALLGWVFYVPMALAGVPPLVFGVVALVDLLYQFWVHTEHVPRLGWFDRWFCSPSNHRVHHAVNDAYVDRNYGGMLIVWDRLFGSFREEHEKCVYGTRSPLNSWDPLWSNAEVYWSLARDSWHTRRWADKLRVWFKPPGWRPADVARRFPKDAFDIAKVETFHPPLTPALMAFGGVQFVLLLVGVLAYLWFADRMPLGQALPWLGALAASLWAIGAVLQGRLGVTQVLMVEAAALSAATAAAAAGHVVPGAELASTPLLLVLHQLFKPLAMLIAIVFVARKAVLERWSGQFASYFLAALAFSLAGDVLLMLKGLFVPGLVAFLLAHLFYIALLRRGVPWFPSRRALAATLGVGCAMYAFLFAGGLPEALRIPVAAYVVVIALMAAQAIGRATLLRDRHAIAVAIGAGLFMLSDALLAVNRFVTPLPLAQLWVLASYYAAQLLITCNARPIGEPGVTGGAPAPVR